MSNEPAEQQPLTGLALLRAPFPPHLISKLPKETKAQSDARKNRVNGCMVWKCEECGGAHHKDATHLDYVGHAALTSRLLDADPDWDWQPVAFAADGTPALDANGGMWIKLTVCGKTRLGYGHADGKRGGDAIKEVIGDALRNAAMRFGAALDLWHKGEFRVDPDGDACSQGGDQNRQGGRGQAGHRNDQQQGGPQRDDLINAEQLTRLQMLLRSAKLDEITFLRVMGAPRGARVCELPASMFGEAVDRLEARLAKMAKDESNERGQQSGQREWDGDPNAFDQASIDDCSL